jgi:DnaJ family protein A protein 2
MNEKDKCKTCKGKKVNKNRKILEVVVEKGMKNGHKIKFSGEADEAPDTIPGDVLFIVQEREHEIFKRKGADLVVTMDLKLSEALCGFTRTITHMDGRILRIDSKPGSVVKPDAVKMIQGEGMPYHGNPFTKGRVFVHFRVQFPTALTPDSVGFILKALPKADIVQLNGEEEECSMSDVDLNQFGQDQGSRTSNAHDEDEDDDGGGRQGQKVQCQNM